MRRSHGRHIGGPRAKRTRERIEMRATGWSPSEVTARILKGLYSTVGPTPKWAQLAYDRGWITLARFLKIPNEPGPTLIYAPTPLFALFKKKTAPAKETA